MVCLSSRSPNADAMLRKASRIALRLCAPRYAVYIIQTPREALEQIDSATQRVISTNLELAAQLGGASMVFKGTDLVSTIASFAKEYGITHIILGRTRHPWHQRWFRQSVLDRLLQTIPGVDVIVLDNASRSL
jgi:two-component system, OmpR family, sensor histidine kinase KdpD